MKQQEQLLLAIKRIRGQLDGIMDMVETERDWLEIVTQIKAATAGLAKVNQNLIKQNMQHCCEQKMSRQIMTQTITEMMAVFFHL